MAVIDNAGDTRLLLLGLAVSLLGVILYQQAKRARARKDMAAAHGCRPVAARYAHKDPVLGLDLLLSNIKKFNEHKICETATDRFRILGNTFEANIVGKVGIFTIEPENVKTILSLKFKDYCIGHRSGPFAPLLGQGIFTTDGDEWNNSRHLIRPNFMREQVADIQAFERHMQALLKHIPRDGSTVDMQKLFFEFTIDSATEFLFGRSTEVLSADAGEGKEFAKAFNRALLDCSIRFRLGFLREFRFGKDKSEGQEANRTCHKYVDKFVDDAILYREKAAASGDVEKEGADGKEKYVFLRELAKSTDDRKRLRDELLNVLLAGRDTTASLLTMTFFQISRRPGVWRKLQEEIGELNGRTPTYEQLRNLKYLKYVLNEVLRLYPVVPFNSRAAIRDTILPVGGGPDGKSPVFVAAGQIVFYTVYAMHRRRDIYGADAEEFRPERWESLRPGWEYLPFNGGPRICLGQQYALTEASYVTARLLQEFGGVEPRDDRPWTEAIALTLASQYGAKVAFTPA